MIIKKSKSITVVSAVLALCMAGSAFAQGRGDRDNDQDRRGNYERRDDDRRGNYERRDDNRRGPPQMHRERMQQDYRDGRQFDRRGFPQPHAEWRRGGHVPREYRGGNYVVNDWRSHRLQQPPRGYQWVGIGGDFVLAAVATGLIAQIIVGQ